MKMLCSDDSSGQLLSSPSEQQTFERVTAHYENKSERFHLKDRQFSRQYAHIYACRLAEMRPKLVEAAKKKWGDVPVRKLFELKTDEKCVITGTLFKHMELKPSILKEISNEHDLIPLPAREKYVDESDMLILEDELQRIVLVDNIDVNTSVTGTVIAIYGIERDEDPGKFCVEDYCYLSLPVPPAIPISESPKYIALVSGLDFGSSDYNPMAIQLMVDLLSGNLGEPGEQEAMSKIVRVVVAGNSLGRETQDKDTMNKAKYLSNKSAAKSVQAIKNLDNFLLQVTSSVEVDIMPGEFDPANYTLPQQPLHRCMFPQSQRYPTMHCVTNPYDCKVEGVRILGTSGQNVQDIYRCSSFEDPIDILESTLKQGHIAPTAPDTLGCYPYYDKDPFILAESPHIYFAGNCSHFKSKIVSEDGRRVLLVCIPRFSKTSTCVLVNLITLECVPMSFQALFPSDNEESPIDK